MMVSDYKWLLCVRDNNRRLQAGAENDCGCMVQWRIVLMEGGRRECGDG